jgi:FRG domain-containing protein
LSSTVDDSEPSPHTTEQRLSSWEEFQQYAAGFEDPTRKRWDEVWFRGQSDAQWPLHTSLERRSTKTRAVADYLNLISEIKPAIETFTGGQFSMPDRFGLEQACRQYDLFDQKLRECATYMVHLRHGGFPSPLLDWTHSPYVAAYFAFHNARHDGDVAIYAYRERPVNFKVGGSDDAQIVSVGPIIKTHKRHFQQQSRYTSCIKFENGQWFFSPHEAVFGQKDHLKQDLLWKMTIPAKERLKVLRFCDKVNLNEFTLFDSEEGLLEMQAMRVFDLRS